MHTVLAVISGGDYSSKHRHFTLFVGQMPEGSQQLKDLIAIHGATSQTVLSGPGSGRLNNLLSELFGAELAWDEKTDVQIKDSVDGEFRVCENVNIQKKHFTELFPEFYGVTGIGIARHVDHVVCLADVG
jgi:hypothetical protein